MFESAFKLLKLTATSFNNPLLKMRYEEIMTLIHQEENEFSEAAEIAQAVNRAYIILSDSKKREHYIIHGQPSRQEPYDNSEAERHAIKLQRLIDKHEQELRHNERERQQLIRQRSRQSREDEDELMSEQLHNNSSQNQSSYLESSLQQHRGTTEQNAVQSENSGLGANVGANADQISERIRETSGNFSEVDMTDTNQTEGVRVSTDEPIEELDGTIGDAEETETSQNHASTPDSGIESNSNVTNLGETREWTTTNNDPNRNNFQQGASQNFEPQPGPSGYQTRNRPTGRTYPEIITISSDSETDLESDSGEEDIAEEMRRYFNLTYEEMGRYKSPPPTYEEALLQTDPIHIYGPNFSNNQEPPSYSCQADQSNDESDHIYQGNSDSIPTGEQTLYSDGGISPTRTDSNDMATSPIRRIETRDFGTSPIQATNLEDNNNQCLGPSVRRNLNLQFSDNNGQESILSNGTTTSTNTNGQASRNNPNNPYNNNSNVSRSFRQFIMELSNMRTRNGITSFKVKWGPDGHERRETAETVMKEGLALRNYLEQLEIEQPRKYTSILHYHPEFASVLVDQLL